MLALFALAVQLVVSFGHIHLPAAAGPTGAVLAAAIATPDADAADRAGKQHPASDGFCSICAAVSLTANAQVPAPPALELPTSVVVPASPVVDEAAPVQRRYVLSQSRGPPVV